MQSKGHAAYQLANEGSVICIAGEGQHLTSEPGDVLTSKMKKQRRHWQSDESAIF